MVVPPVVAEAAAHTLRNLVMAHMRVELVGHPGNRLRLQVAAAIAAAVAIVAVVAAVAVAVAVAVHTRHQDIPEKREKQQGEMLKASTKSDGG